MGETRNLKKINGATLKIRVEKLLLPVQSHGIVAFIIY